MPPRQREGEIVEVISENEANIKILAPGKSSLKIERQVIKNASQRLKLPWKLCLVGKSRKKFTILRKRKTSFP